ncbi:AraC family transcriptional regulator [Paenibacillus filicis]|uniref:AraC family transcriptional regulator n=1 Tax=Paenibacillus gyeongsangnamensis TaxID=3388067 RepID=A0ABT4QL38_9BACL|nr:AraC family transcriptional regulator [Paenibacillus filicis]MCZ8517575.1 AraC family transcriptional regulator [Paenibacillus filicis]
MKTLSKTLFDLFGLQGLRRSFYRRSLLILLTMSCLPNALFGLIIYYFETGQIEREVNQYHQYQLKQAANRVEDSLSHLELISSQWAFDPVFDERLRTINLRDQFSETQTLYKTLAVLKGSDLLIDQVYLYLRDSAVLINNDQGVIFISNEADKKLYTELLQGSRGIYWTDAFTKQKGNMNVFPISLIVKLPGTASQSYGALLITLDKKRVSDLISNLNDFDNGTSLLIRENGDLISLGRLNAQKPTALELAVRDLVAGQKQEMASNIFNFQNNDYSVSYRKFSRLGAVWTFTTVTPLSQITWPVVFASRLIFGISGGVIVLLIVLSLFASRKLYGPVRRLVGLLEHNKSPENAAEEKDEFTFIEKRWNHISRESQLLQARIEQQLPGMREVFLLQLIQGRLALSESELKERMVQLGWETNGKHFAVVYLQFFGFSNLKDRFKEGDEPLVSFAIANIIGDVARKYFSDFNVLNFMDLSVGMFILHDSHMQKEHVKADIFAMLGNISSILDSMLDMQTTSSVGRLTGDLKRIPEIMEEAKHALRYRDLQMRNQVMDMDDLLQRGEQPIHYPFALEIEVIQAIRMGMEEDAVHQISRFKQELQIHADNELQVKQGMQMLLGKIQYTMLESDFNPHKLSGGANLFDQLYQMRDLEEIPKWFRHKVIQPYVKKLSETYNIQIKQLVENVMETMRTHYMRDISLEWCADLHGTYPQKLSSAFKYITGTNFIDHLTNLRMENAKKLLLEADTKINDIAVQVGYQPSYFNRIFKKHEGMTPGEYREKRR